MKKLSLFIFTLPILLFGFSLSPPNGSVANVPIYQENPKLSYSFSKWYNAVDWSGGSNFEPLSENINVVVSRDKVEVWMGGSLEIAYNVQLSQMETVEGQSVKAYYFTDEDGAIFYQLSDGTDAVLFVSGSSLQNLVWIDWD